MVETQLTQQTPHDYVLQSFIIHSHRHSKPVDVAGNVVMFQIYEDINKPYLTGNFILHDDIRFADGIKLNGTELVEITLTQPGVDGVPVTLNFMITTIDDTQKTSDNVEILTLSMIEQNLFNNSLKEFSKAYQGKPSEIIKKICMDQLGLGVDMPEVSEAQSSMKIVIPFQNAFSACSMMLGRMTTINGLPYYLFRTMKHENLQLKSLEEMMLQSSWNKQPYVFSNASKSQSQQRLTTENIFNVEKYSSSNMDGIFDMVVGGMVGSTYTIVDAGSGASESFHHNLDDTYRMLTNLGIIETTEEPTIATGTYGIDNVEMEKMSNVISHGLIFNNTYNNHKNFHQELYGSELKLMVTKRAIQSLLNKGVVKMQVPGLPFLVDQEHRSLGTNVDLITMSNNTDVDATGDKLIDKRRSGKYMIFGARHIFDENDQHRTNIAISKLGSGK